MAEITYRKYGVCQRCDVTGGIQDRDKACPPSRSLGYRAIIVGILVRFANLERVVWCGDNSASEAAVTMRFSQ
jgi:hypothetical protein